MSIREKASSWVIRKIIKSKLEDIDNPGFLIAKIGPGDSGKTVRKLYLSEDLLVSIENTFEEEYGDKGIKALYKAGKRKGNRFMNISEFPRYGEVSEKNLMRFFRFFSSYVEIVYADKMDQNLDLENETYSSETEGFSICRKNGKGYILSSGTPAGALSYLFSDNTIESAKPKFEGKGYDKCVIDVGRPEKLEEETVARYPEIEEEFLSSDYDKMNGIKETEHSKTSLANAERSKFDYDGEKLEVKGDRHLIVEVCMIYFIEQEAEKINAGKTLFECGFERGEELAENENIGFVQGYLSALGWGDARLSEDEAVLNYFPWMPIASEIEFNLVRGMISGMMSEATGNKVEYTDFETETYDGLKLILKS